VPDPAPPIARPVTHPYVGVGRKIVACAQHSSVRCTPRHRPEHTTRAPSAGKGPASRGHRSLTPNGTPSFSRHPSTVRTRSPHLCKHTPSPYGGHPSSERSTPHQRRVPTSSPA
jgi:hypothetical protein